MLIDGQFKVAASPERVLAHLFDARLMASCLPGCESLEAQGDDRYRAVVVVALAGVKARFDLTVEVTAREADGVRAVTRGEEGGNASTLQATSEVRLKPEGDGTRVDYRSDVAVTGRLGRFALGMMKKKAQNLGEEFATNLQARLAEGPASATVAVEAISSTSESTPSPTVAPAPRSDDGPGREPRDDASPWKRFMRWLRRMLGLSAPASRERG